MASSYVPKYAGTIDAVVDDKMKVLYELCVVDHNTYNSAREKLVAEIKKYPDLDMQRVADRVARKLFYEKFNKD